MSRYDIQDWVCRAREHGIGEAVIERVVRLNPHPEEGRILRGIQIGAEQQWLLMTGLMRKMEFVRRYGRERFAALDRQAIVKRGRRVFVARCAVAA